MAIEEQKTTQVVSKAQKFEVYLGTPSEKLGVGLDPDTNCNIDIKYCVEMAEIDLTERMKDSEGNPINPRVVVSVGQVEQDFPGTIALLTQIANHYNPFK